MQLASEAVRLVYDEGEGGERPEVLLAISSSRETELEQQDALFSSARPPQLVVGTPQRLADLCNHPRARPVLRSVSTIVLLELYIVLVYACLCFVLYR